MKSSLCDSAQDTPPVPIGFEKTYQTMSMLYSRTNEYIALLEYHPFERCHFLVWFIPQFAQ